MPECTRVIRLHRCSVVKALSTTQRDPNLQVEDETEKDPDIITEDGVTVDQEKGIQPGWSQTNTLFISPGNRTYVRSFLIKLCSCGGCFFVFVYCCLFVFVVVLWLLFFICIMRVGAWPAWISHVICCHDTYTDDDLMNKSAVTEAELWADLATNVHFIKEKWRIKFGDIRIYADKNDLMHTERYY